MISSVRRGERPKRVAVVRALRGLGDMLCVVPALRALRQALPDASLELVGLEDVHWMVERYPHYLDQLVEFPGYPGIPEAPAHPPRLARFLADVQGSYDLALQMHGSGTNSNAFTMLLGARETAGYYLPALWQPDPELFTPYPAHSHEIHIWTGLVEFLGHPAAGDHLEFPVGDEDRLRLRRTWNGSAEGRYVCLHPGANEEVRRWPAEHFVAVGDRLSAAGFDVVLTGSEREAELTAQIAAQLAEPATDLSGKTSLGQMAALLEGAALLVCNDTGVSHLAAAIGSPSVVVFAASEPERWAPLDRKLHRVVGEPRPERRNACRHTPDVRGHRCLRDACACVVAEPSEEWRPATVDEVMAQAGELLAERQRVP